MTDWTVVPEDGLSNALRLKELLGGDSAIANLPSGHPFLGGFRALRSHVSGARLSDVDRAELAELELIATGVFRYQVAWSGHRDEIIALLKSPRQCPSLTFELQVGMRTLEKVSNGVKWQSFEHSSPDWSIDDPTCFVECKLARSSDKAENYSDYLSQAAKQHRHIQAPLVIAVGFDETLTDEVLKRMDVQAMRHLAWMTRHREVSRVLVYGRSGYRSHGSGPLGLNGFIFGQEHVIEISNHSAEHPLPENFRFGSGPETFRETFPGPMESLTRPMAQGGPR